MSFEIDFNYNTALVRPLARSFEGSLKRSQPLNPIDMIRAETQHQKYIRLLKDLVPQLVEIASDDAHPDCNFIEDTSIIVGNTAIISRLGAVERRGEEEPVREKLKELGFKNVYDIAPPGTMDGGDILFTGKHLFVGLSRRTNSETLRQLQNIFKNQSFSVQSIDVVEELHLKSAVSILSEDTLIISDTEAGRLIKKQIECIGGDYQFIQVPDSASANVLRVGAKVIIQAGFPRSEEILSKTARERGLEVISLNMSELIKADGALTCGSLLFSASLPKVVQ